MLLNLVCKIFYLMVSVYCVRAISPTFLLNDNTDSESEIVAVLPSKGYLPRDADLPKSRVIPNNDFDASYFLSKLTNQELIALLKDQPTKNHFDMKDIVKASKSPKNGPDRLNNDRSYKSLSKMNNNKDLNTQADSQNPMTAYFRLDNKKVDPYNFKTGVNPDYLALQKIKNLLHSQPLNQDSVGLDSDDKKELLFDMLTAQLKKLCCKSNNPKNAERKKTSYESLLNNLFSNSALNKNTAESEHLFLIINDEIKNDESDDLISVDPESLNQNSSVLILGAITTPLVESQLKSVMTRITNEISKPEYLPILQQLSEGKLSNANTRVMKSLVSGPETRRYIKPHRCNHQSTLAKIYGGPKWIICSGYLNLNTPSLYD